MRDTFKTLSTLLLLCAAVRAGESDFTRPPEPRHPKEPKLSPLLTDQPWAQQRAIIKKAWLDYMGSFPETRAPLNARILEEQDEPEYTRKHVEYVIEEGIVTDSWLLTPKKAADKMPAMVVFHPTDSVHTARVAGINKSQPDEMHGVALVKQGYVVLCPRCFIFDSGADYAGNVKKMQARHPDWTGMARMTFDGLRAVDYLESLPNVDRERIGVCGHSLGAKETLYTAAFDERVKAAVFSEGGIGLSFSNWEAVWYLGAKIKEPGFALDNHQLIGLIAPRAFFLLAGNDADDDRSWAYIEAAQPVYKSLNAYKNVGWLNHRQGHKFSGDGLAAAVEFLDRHLKRQ